jgi:hypothetical protein
MRIIEYSNDIGIITCSTCFSVIIITQCHLKMETLCFKNIIMNKVSRHKNKHNRTLSLIYMMINTRLFKKTFFLEDLFRFFKQRVSQSDYHKHVSLSLRKYLEARIKAIQLIVNRDKNISIDLYQIPIECSYE